MIATHSKEIIGWRPDSALAGTLSPVSPVAGSAAAASQRSAGRFTFTSFPPAKYKYKFKYKYRVPHSSERSDQLAVVNSHPLHLLNTNKVTNTNKNMNKNTNTNTGSLYSARDPVSWWKFHLHILST